MRAVRSGGVRRNAVTWILPIVVIVGLLVTVGLARASNTNSSKKQPVSQEAPLGLYLSTRPDRGDAVPLNRAVVRGKIYVSAAAGSDQVTAVSFWLNDASTDPSRIEKVFPYDFAGGAPDGSANAFDTATLGNGTHVIFVEITRADQSKVNTWAAFTVDNGGGVSVPTPSASPTPKPTPSATTAAPEKPATGGGKCPLPAYPNADCTGVPAGTKLTTVNGDYVARKAGEVIEGKKITGDLTVQAANVKIRNSEIHGEVKNTSSQTFEITDSTVGPPSGCVSAAAVGNHHYTATRVHLRNFSDGFRNEGDNILIQDSFVELCSTPGDHSDGIQGYHGGSNVVIRHTTVDQRGARKEDVTSPIFFADGSKGAVVENNMFIGGGYTVRLYGSGYTFANNVVVNKAWLYGPAANDCGGIKWSGNKLVEIGSNYQVTKVVGTLNCA